MIGNITRLILRAIKFEDALKFANENNLNYIEVSAKTGHNIEKLFDTITASLYEAQVGYTKNDRTIGF